MWNTLRVGLLAFLDGPVRASVRSNPRLCSIKQQGSKLISSLLSGYALRSYEWLGVEASSC